LLAAAVIAPLVSLVAFLAFTRLAWKLAFTGSLGTLVASSASLDYALALLAFFDFLLDFPDPLLVQSSMARPAFTDFTASFCST
jgi:hypothetical protein